MTAYNNLASALILCFAAQSSYALTFNAAQVESTQGQLLYVEIPYANASDNSAIQASLADPDDLIRMGASQQDVSGLNFFVRRTGNSSGVIVITSSQPMSNKNINLIVRVKDGDGVHLQQIQKNLGNDATTNNKTATTPANITASTQEHALIPKQIVSEKDIALNLPESMLYNKAATALSTNPSVPENLLAISVAPAPAIKAPAPSNSTTSATAASPMTTATTSSQTPAAHNTQPQPTLTSINKAVPDTHKPVPAVSKAPTKPAAPPPTTAKEVVKNSNYVVQRQDSLWSIAARISGQTHQPIGEVMKHIKALNEHAFIGGNINRLRAGSNLNLGNTPHPTSPANGGKMTNPTAAGKFSTKYRLDQAEMTLVTENPNPASAKMGGNAHTTLSTSPELSLKVMTIRKKTVTLQKNVVQLDLALQQKDHQIQLLNARLAQLQQQLQQQQKAKKPSHH